MGITIPIRETFSLQPTPRLSHRVPTTLAIMIHHDHEVSCVKPEKLPPRVFRPPMLLDFLNEAPAEQGFINHVNDIRGDHEPERED
jgi:hypothetical protein